jgi:hypothetical protein
MPEKTLFCEIVRVLSVFFKLAAYLSCPRECVCPMPMAPFAVVLEKIKNQKKAAAENNWRNDLLDNSGRNCKI